jgi:hypothetical protein
MNGFKNVRATPANIGGYNPDSLAFLMARLKAVPAQSRL